MLFIITSSNSCIHSISDSPQCAFYDDPNNSFKGRGNGDLPLPTSTHRILSSFSCVICVCSVQQAKKVIEDKQGLKTSGTRTFALWMRFPQHFVYSEQCSTAGICETLCVPPATGCWGTKWVVYSSCRAMTHVWSKGQWGWLTGVWHVPCLTSPP